MKVLDEAISRWINKLFGGLIEAVTPESINVSAREGRAQLENLTIRPSWYEQLPASHLHVSILTDRLFL